jgi:hypothetical protein
MLAPVDLPISGPLLRPRLLAAGVTTTSCAGSAARASWLCCSAAPT